MCQKDLNPVHPLNSMEMLKHYAAIGVVLFSLFRSKTSNDVRCNEVENFHVGKELEK